MSRRGQLRCTVCGGRVVNAVRTGGLCTSCHDGRSHPPDPLVLGQLGLNHPDYTRHLGDFAIKNLAVNAGCPVAGEEMKRRGLK